MEDKSNLKNTLLPRDHLRVVFIPVLDLLNLVLLLLHSSSIYLFNKERTFTHKLSHVAVEFFELPTIDLGELARGQAVDQFYWELFTVQLCEFFERGDC